MISSEPQALLLEILRQQHNSLWLIAIIAVIGAAIGAYGAAYLRKRGEDRALSENFAAIREQLRTTTQDTEEIKQHLSSHTWRSQQLWSARETYYSSLLTQLHHFRMALLYLSGYYLEPGSEHLPDSQLGEHFQRLLADAVAANNEVQKLVGPAAIFLTLHATTALDKLFKDHWELANLEAICTSDYVDHAQILATNAYMQILSEAKSHLGLKGDA
jgi:hypothetical protein